MIEVQHLVRVFTHQNGFVKKNISEKIAVNDISFVIREGETLALLGPNGAGKTTTIKILSTLLAPTSGSSSILGYDTFLDAKKVRSKINFIFGGESGVYRRISGRENMEYFASLYHLVENEKKHIIDELLALVNLQEAQHNKVETYSKGMIQRLQIARGLLNDPEVLFMDEPTLGLDPIGARDLRQIILSLKQKKKTILLTTHDMREADILSDRIAVINNGKIIALDTSDNLKQRYQLDNVLEVRINGEDSEALYKIKKLPYVKHVKQTKDTIHDYFHIQYNGLKNNIVAILSCFQNEIIEVKEHGTTLEDVYIRLIEGDQNGQ